MATSRLTLLLSVLIVLPACSRAEPPASESASSAASPALEVDIESEPVGIRACDDYLAWWKACLVEHSSNGQAYADIPELSNRHAVWRMNAQAGYSQSELARQCSEQHAAKRESLRERGCD